MASMNHKDFVSDITAMLDRAEPPMTADCCIYRVPFDIRRLNEDAYTPKVVSVGPFHHRNPRLQNMERHKLLYCKMFLERAKVDLDILIRHVEEIEPNVRCCYSETLELNSRELVKVILVDSGFIFELFWRFFYDDWSEADTFLLKPWVRVNIRLDLLLLENQLPFLYLEKLFNLAFVNSLNVGRIPSFLKLTFEYFGYYNRSKIAIEEIVSIRHFTDLLRTFHVQQQLRRDPVRLDDSKIHLQSATELLEAGVRFRENANSDCLLDLIFSGRVLEIPQLQVVDGTETLFRNLVALEQCHYPYESYFTDYVAILDFLINTSKDVDVLVRYGILHNWLGDSESVANLFNGLWKNVTHVNFSSRYFGLCEELNAFCRNPWHKMKATLKRDYCSSPWQTAASIAGIVLLILSLVQTVCSVLQLVQQYKASPNT